MGQQPSNTLDGLNAVAQIRSDLNQLQQRRRLALISYIATLGLILVALGLLPAKETSLERNGPWFVALAALVVAAVVCGSAAIGIPLMRRKTFFMVGGLGATGLVGGLVAVMLWSPSAQGTMGMKCFMYGTTFSTIALVILGFISGRLWRKFPDPGLIIAIGVTAVGVCALHFSCGGTDPVHLFGFHLTPLLVAYGLARLATLVRQKLIDDQPRAPSSSSNQ